MERALRAADKDVRLVRLEGTGHSYPEWDAEQVRIFYSELDAFLGENLPR
jgi:dipeptidyl aminopeptidase/acylaminoacyl peptidase